MTDLETRVKRLRQRSEDLEDALVLVLENTRHVSYEEPTKYAIGKIDRLPHPDDVRERLGIR